MKFNELNISEPILRALDEVGYQEPTPIQQQAIPPVLEGRDVLGCAQTGTGKTAAFAVPILQNLGRPREKQAKGRPIRALILTPTRELALQIFENFEQYGRHTERTSAVIFGGVSQMPQVEQLKKGVDVLIATPGRLWDLMGQKQVSLAAVECFVLDEADRMLDMGFFPDVKRIIRALPEKRQTLLFSATMPPEIQGLADSLLTDPVHISVTPAATPVEAIHQSVYMVDRCNKRALLAHVIRERGAEQALVFTRTKHGADRVARELKKNGISADSIHGDKSQGARQRALSDFKAGRVSVLVATDIAARGIDISGLPLVINFDLPEIPETYVHRIGRTGRAGLEGTAISFCDGAQTSYLIDIEELTGRRIEEVEEHPFPMTGEQPAEPEPKPEQRRRTNGDRRTRRDAPRTQPKKPATPPQEKKLPAEKRAPRTEGEQPAARPARQPRAQQPRSEQLPKTERQPRAEGQPKQQRAKSVQPKPAQNVQPKPAQNEQAHTTEAPHPVQPRKAGNRGGRGGRRVIDNDRAQTQTKPLPARELSPSLRERIAAKVAAVLGMKQPAVPVREELPTEGGDAAPPKRRRRGGRGRGKKTSDTGNKTQE